MLSHYLAYVNNLCYNSYVMLKIDTLPPTAGTSPALDVVIDTEGFAEQELQVSANLDAIKAMMSDYYGMSDEGISQSSIIIGPPKNMPLSPLRKQSVRGFFVSNAELTIDGEDRPQRNVSAIHPPSSRITDRVSHFLKTGEIDPPASDEQQDYNAVLLHEMSHNSDYLKGELGTKISKKLRKIGGSVIGLATGLFIQSKLGVISETAPSDNILAEGLKHSAEYYLRTMATLGSIAIGKYAGYRSIPTERRAFKAMSDERALEKYGDMIQVSPLRNPDQAEDLKT